MASACNKMINRTSIRSLKSAAKSKIRAFSLSGSATSTSSGFLRPSRPISSPLHRFTARSPSELGCAQSLLPLHSAVAAARMTSCLSSTSRSCRALSQDTFDDT